MVLCYGSLRRPEQAHSPQLDYKIYKGPDFVLFTAISPAPRGHSAYSVCTQWINDRMNELPVSELECGRDLASSNASW